MKSFRAWVTARLTLLGLRPSNVPTRAAAPTEGYGSNARSKRGSRNARIAAFRGGGRGAGVSLREAGILLGTLACGRFMPQLRICDSVDGYTSHIDFVVRESALILSPYRVRVTPSHRPWHCRSLFYHLWPVL
eukprot:SAG11_NODE_1743_length_4335_cov_1.760387_1_plen_133_part_00